MKGWLNTTALSMACVLCLVMIVYFMVEIDEASIRRKYREQLTGLAERLGRVEPDIPPTIMGVQ